MSIPSIQDSYNKGTTEGYRWIEIAFDCWECQFEHAFHHGDTPPPVTKSGTWDTRGVIDLHLPLAPQLAKAKLSGTGDHDAISVGVPPVGARFDP